MRQGYSEGFREQAVRRRDGRYWIMEREVLNADCGLGGGRSE